MMAVRASFGGFSSVTRASYFRFISALKRMAAVTSEGLAGDGAGAGAFSAITPPP
jgi:hypothetical protein